jgi:glycosyltransferase involved in cell wall biosynthesis
VDHGRFRPRAVDAAAVARRYGVPSPFVLFVGSLLPWRNTPRLLRAVARLRQRFLRLRPDSAPPGLLIVGRDVWGTDPTRRLAAEQGWTDWARFTGYVSDDELPSLYAAAAVFAYPSLYDGFGIPPVEAMACGTPVVASTAGALPEVLGDAAVLVDPTDEEMLAEGLQAAFDHADDLRQRGLARAARYSWDQAAEQTWAVYRQVVAGQ